MGERVVTIVPGFASMYRTDAVAQIDVTGAGLVIEDFNMTFEIHAKKLRPFRDFARNGWPLRGSSTIRHDVRWPHNTYRYLPTCA